MATKVKIRNVGNAKGITIPKLVLEQLQMKQGDSLDVIVQENGLLLKKEERNSHKTIEQRFAEFEKERNTIVNEKEVDWGEPRGNEAW